MLAMWHLLALVADAAVVGASLAGALRFQTRFEPLQHLALLAIGAALATSSVTAAWLALGPLSVPLRMAVAPLICFAALFAAALPLVATHVNPEAVIGVFLAGIAQFLLLQAPIWLIRTWHRLRIAQLEELAESGPIERLQYSLWQMLAVMTLVAVALGIGRGIMALVGPFRGPGGLTLIFFFVLLVAYSLLLAWPLIWAVLSPSGVMWKGACAAVLVALVLTITYPLTISVLGRGEGPWLYWLAFVPQPAYLLAHLLATRASGYRLVQYG